MELVITGTTIDIRNMSCTIDVNLIVTAIGIQVHDIDFLRKVDTFDIRIGECRRIVLILWQQGNETETIFRIHTHQQGIVVFSTFNGKHIVFRTIARIRDIRIVGIATPHHRNNHLVITTLAIDKVHARTRSNLVTTRFSKTR